MHFICIFTTLPSPVVPVQQHVSDQRKLLVASILVIVKVYAAAA
jgi:hypothetical protein